MEPTAIPATFPVTVMSADGRQVVFEEPPERIVAFDSAAVEILFAIGAEDRIAATHAFVSYPAETAENSEGRRRVQHGHRGRGGPGA